MIGEWAKNEKASSFVYLPAEACTPTNPMLSSNWFANFFL